MKNVKIVLENIWIENGYYKEYILNVDAKTFDKKYDEKFGQYIEDKLCDDFDRFGIYEYDGISGDMVYIQITLEEDVDDLENTYKHIEEIIEVFLKNKKLI
jgi:hypothetical protein